MAHAARLNELGGALVTSITGKPQDDSSFETLRDQAVRSLREHRYARTNPFEITVRYSGLVEKFGVLNRDDLSEALQQRLDRLSKESKWLPEFLSLLLQLSDKPAEKTDLQDLPGLSHLTASPPGLTWEQIVANDPLDELGIWDSVERGYHSSGDDANSEGEWEPTVSTAATSVHEDDPAALARTYVVAPDDRLDGVRSARKVLDVCQARRPTDVPELFFVRETLTSLHGLPTDLYACDDQTLRRTVNKRYIMATTAQATVRHLLLQFADMSTELDLLRQWLSSEQEADFVRSMQAAAHRSLAKVEAKIDEIEMLYANPKPGTIISMVRLHVDVQQCVEPVLHLSRLIRSASLSTGGSQDDSSLLLDTLYTEACLAQVSCNQEHFVLLNDVFLAGVKSYLRPIRDWITTASLPTNNSSTFFIKEHDTTEYSLGSTWTDRFSLRPKDDSRYVPSFMQGCVAQMFAMGKTRAFMRQLDRSDVEADSISSTEYGLPNFTDLQAHLLTNPFLPFSQLFENELQTWLHAPVNKSTQIQLCQSLLQDHGFGEVLRALDFIYLARDGALFQSFAEALFSWMDTRSIVHHDRFLLTELLHNTIGVAPAVSAGNLFLECSLDKQNRSLIAIPAMRRLRDLHLKYTFSWPVQNITRCTTSATHSQAFVLLLQIHRARTFLHSQLFALRYFSGGKTSPTTLGDDITTALYLRRRLMWFTEITHSHFTNTSSTLHSAMIDRMEKADGVDAMSAIWEDYIRQLETGLLLSANLAPIREAIDGQLEACEHFAQGWRHRIEPDMTSAVDGAEAEHHESMHSAHGRSVRDAYFARMLEDFDKNISFIVTGLRGVSRAGGNIALELLADRLNWQTPTLGP